MNLSKKEEEGIEILTFGFDKVTDVLGNLILINKK